MPLSNLTERAAVLKAIEEYDRIGRTAFLSRYGFGPSRDYVLRFDGREYDSKAIAGAAVGYQFPDLGALQSSDVVGGDRTVRRKLEGLGFEVTRLSEAWSREEVERTVADYFEMLALEARDEAYSKKSHRERLRTELKGRSDGSVEFKHQNISAVLNELGLPFIQGYKPRINVQDLLREVVRETIEKRQDLLAAVVDGFEALRVPADPNYHAALVNPPVIAPLEPGLRPKVRIPRKCDYALRDENNRRLGSAGEKWSIEFETTRLANLDCQELARRIEWVADSRGDGLGYDILSFEQDATERYIEVKTTNGGPQTPFVVSANELAFSLEKGSAFYLYRLFQFRSKPRLFILRGDLSAHLALTPIDFRARLKSLTR